MTGKLGVALLFFMIFLLSFGAWMFTVIAKRLAVEPIERMLAVLDIVSLSLRAFKVAGGLVLGGVRVRPVISEKLSLRLR